VLATLAVVLGAVSLMVRLDVPPANVAEPDLSLEGLELSYAGIEAPTPKPRPSRTATKDHTIQHTVLSGESLFSIAEHYSLPEVDLMSLLLSSRKAERLRALQPGQRVDIGLSDGEIHVVELFAYATDDSPAMLSAVREQTGRFSVKSSLRIARPTSPSPASRISDASEPAPTKPVRTKPPLPAKVTTTPQRDPPSSIRSVRTDGAKVIKVASGDSLYGIFKSDGYPLTDMHHILRSGKEAQALKRLQPGETIEIALNGQGGIETLVYRPSRTLSVHFERQPGGTSFLPRKHKRDYERRIAVISATIKSSLYLSATAAGMPDALIAQLVEIFGWDIDFALDIRRGDTLTVLYEKLYLDGQFVRTGPVLAARFANQGRTFRAVRYELDGRAEYFTPEGARLRRAFIRTPVRFARISSGFSLRRRHPILHTIRAHRGVDYAAPRGTPVRATGDGRVIYAARKGGYGKTVVIQHGGVYTTLYAHLTRYAKKLRRGSRVRQGQTIGYVGSTGLATGPHLHYEFRVRGIHRNPLTVPLPRANGLKKSERPKFLAAAKGILRQLDAAVPTKLAQASTD